MAAPLGLQPRASRQGVPLGGRLLGVGVLCAMVAGLLFLSSKMKANQPQGPEGRAVIERAVTIRNYRAEDSAGRRGAGEPMQRMPDELPARASAPEVEAQSGVSVIRQHGGAVPGAAIIRVPDAAENPNGAASTDPRISERSQFGLLPRISEGGLTPRRFYARNFVADGKPAIAVVLTGVGISQRSTNDAINRLSGAFTLAFAPYGRDLEAQVGRARRTGHEILLQIPMEPFDYPDNDPGPHTLRSGFQPTENIERLHWLMSRFAGYVGILNFMGEKLMATPAAFQPVLEEINRRGLVFVDDGGGQRSRTLEIAGRIGLPVAKADIVNESGGSGRPLRTLLAEAEALAKKNGRAILTVPALPANIELLAAWELEIKGRGIELAPVSALVGTRPK